jgi:hypothetical protein
MKVCPKCGYREIVPWRYSRFDFNAEYLRFDKTKKKQKKQKQEIHTRGPAKGFFYFFFLLVQMRALPSIFL